MNGGRGNTIRKGAALQSTSTSKAVCVYHTQLRRCQHVDYDLFTGQENVTSYTVIINFCSEVIKYIPPSVNQDESHLAARIKALPHSAAPLLGSANSIQYTHTAAGCIEFQTRGRKLRPLRVSRALRSLNFCGTWCFQHLVGGVQLEESNITCHGRCSSLRTSRAARRDSVVVGGHRTATDEAAGYRGSIATDLSPHGRWWRVTCSNAPFTTQTRLLCSFNQSVNSRLWPNTHHTDGVNYTRFRPTDLYVRGYQRVV